VRVPPCRPARRVGRQAAHDLVAETFLVAFRKRAGYDDRCRDARPWLYGIATNLIAQHRREEARQFRLRQAAAPEPVQQDHAERAVLDVTAQSIRASLARALARLARPDRGGEQGQLGGDALVQTAIVDRAGEMP
jgi:DNA-directed RNA polymerase specialized sigma24 family protein